MDSDIFGNPESAECMPSTAVAVAPQPELTDPTPTLLSEIVENNQNAVDLQQVLCDELINKTNGLLIEITRTEDEYQDLKSRRTQLALELADIISKAKHELTPGKFNEYLQYLDSPADKTMVSKFITIAASDAIAALKAVGALNGEGWNTLWVLAGLKQETIKELQRNGFLVKDGITVTYRKAVLMRDAEKDGTAPEKAKPQHTGNRKPRTTTPPIPTPAPQIEEEEEDVKAPCRPIDAEKPGKARSVNDRIKALPTLFPQSSQTELDRIAADIKSHNAGKSPKKPAKAQDEVAHAADRTTLAEAEAEDHMDAAIALTKAKIKAEPKEKTITFQLVMSFADYETNDEEVTRLMDEINTKVTTFKHLIPSLELIKLAA
jgi:hypothetical protein